MLALSGAEMGMKIAPRSSTGANSLGAAWNMVTAAAETPTVKAMMTMGMSRARTRTRR